MTDLVTIEKEVTQAVNEFLDLTDMASEDIFVLGLSSSEVIGGVIGKSTSREVGEVIVRTLKKILDDRGIYLAVQGCEHINRSLVVERKLAKTRNLEIVTVVPHLTAGGAGTVAAYEQFEDAVVVEHIQAQGGMDIGDTSIGMQVKHVQVPIRTSVKEIGAAHVTYLHSRPKLIGGERAHYTWEY